MLNVKAKVSNKGKVVVAVNSHIEKYGVVMDGDMSDMLEVVILNRDQEGTYAMLEMKVSIIFN